MLYKTEKRISRIWDIFYIHASLKKVPIASFASTHVLLVGIVAVALVFIKSGSAGRPKPVIMAVLR